MKRSILKNPTTGIYHVTVRGNNKEFIFDDAKGKRKYINNLKTAKEFYGFELFAWVIMSNHVHLLIKVNHANLPSIMHNLQLRYSRWFNYKYNHTGHVFGGPYKVRECRDYKYFTNIIRYIHQNPERAKLSNMNEYLWCSHHDYKEHPFWGITDTEKSHTLSHDSSNITTNNYRKFMKEKESTLPELDIEEIYIL